MRGNSRAFVIPSYVRTEKEEVFSARKALPVMFTRLRRLDSWDFIAKAVGNRSYPSYNRIL